MTRYLTVDEVLDLHRWSLQTFGGAEGILNLGMVESAVAQPQGAFGGVEFYPTLFQKAAALGFALVMNHPFVDGNKRTGYWAIVTFLQLNGYELVCATDAGEQAVLAVASGQWSREQLASWIEAQYRPIQPPGGSGDASDEDPTQAD